MLSVKLRTSLASVHIVHICTMTPEMGAIDMSNKLVATGIDIHVNIGHECKTGADVSEALRYLASIYDQAYADDTVETHHTCNVWLRGKCVGFYVCRDKDLRSTSATLIYAAESTLAREPRLTVTTEDALTRYLRTVTGNKKP